MNQEINLWPTLFAAFLSALAMYIGFINKMRSQIAVLEAKVKDLEEECDKATAKMTEMTHTIGILEEKVKRLEMRQDSQSKKNDEVIKLINDFKLEITRQIGDVNKNIIKIQGEVEVINKTIAIFDGGVVGKKE